MEIEIDEELDFAEDLNQGDLLEEEFDAIEQSWQEEALGSQALIIFGEVLMTMVTSALNSCRSLVFIRPNK